MQSRYEYWEHGQSGEVFAVRLDDGGRLTGLAGPLFSTQIRPDDTSTLRFDASPSYLSWIEGHRDNWYPIDLALPPHY